jgi:hypothetical protein
MSMTRGTLVDMYHPLFRRGYRLGRQCYFQDPRVFTDKTLVECLWFIFGEQEGAERWEELYLLVGQLLGLMSGCVIPQQSDEEGMPDLQEVFLAGIEQEYGDGESGQAIVDGVRLFWSVRDQLARVLGAETFEMLLDCGVKKGRRDV